MYIILLGAPGAGKGTQAAVLAKKLNLAHIASGDLFRQALNNGTRLGLQAKTYMERGALVPDEVTTQMVLERLAAPDCQTGAILDGFPRNLAQARALDEALSEQDKAVDKVVYIKVREEELLKRLGGRWICRNCQTPYHTVDSPPKVAGKCDKCGGELYQRSDDTIETARKRLKVYFNETAPLIDYYTARGKLVEVDGVGTIEGVTRKVQAVLHPVRATRK